MKDINPLRRTIGLILIMIGSFWAAISLGFLEESFMTGQPVYTVLGLGVVTAEVTAGCRSASAGARHAGARRTPAGVSAAPRGPPSHRADRPWR